MKRDLPPKKFAKVIASLLKGSTRRDACGEAGISDETLRRWLQNVDLCKKVEAAEEAAARRPDVEKKMNEAFATGCNVQQALLYAEIDDPTYRRMRRRWHEFANACDRARGAARVAAFAAIRAKFAHDWRAALEWLKMVHDPEIDTVSVTELRHTGKTETQITGVLTHEQYDDGIWEQIANHPEDKSLPLKGLKHAFEPAHLPDDWPLGLEWTLERWKLYQADGVAALAGMEPEMKY
jgi:predicted site-specific integrase-resolvase